MLIIDLFGNLNVNSFFNKFCIDQGYTLGEMHCTRITRPLAQDRTIGGHGWLKSEKTYKNE
jgi:hypothetical protein